MATTLSNPSITINTRASLASGIAPAVLGCTVNQSPATSIGVGSTAGNVNVCFSEAFTVTSGTPITVNLLTGTDPFGTALGMVHVSHILVENASTTTGQDFTVGGGTHPVLGTDLYLCQANGGVVCVVNPNPGYSVVTSSSDTLQISVAAGTSVAGRITVLGRTA